MEGNGPGNGDSVPHRIAIASTDYVQRPRGRRSHGMDPEWIGYLGFCAKAGRAT